ncbi:hypothetical protein NDU88_003624 [Pleurodeles waltl]|uniref:Uncharacterized protein n=1 Tax=Pleurodeles waltl TaxID=8319 RepID=A0AAV7SGG6_PLEWA|nr:hypothetical protein NDU88_003624 [Pleurodeles waltl]
MNALRQRRKSAIERSSRRAATQRFKPGAETKKVGPHYITIDTYTEDPPCAVFSRRLESGASCTSTAWCEKCRALAAVWRGGMHGFQVSERAGWHRPTLQNGYVTLPARD